MELPVKSPAPAGRRASYKLQTKDLSYELTNKIDAFNWVDCANWFQERSRKLVLNCVTCEARTGELTAIAGPSGAGKTTLLEILAGKISPQRVSGHVLINGNPLDPTSFRAISGFVTQEDALFPLLTVQETLMYSALLRLRQNRKEAEGRVRMVIQELGLCHVARSRVGEGSRFGISGGERRRVSIGVDLVHDPDVILVDEPTSGLDSASALQVVTLLKSIAVRQGKTIVLTIHQPGFRILEQINHVILLSNGLIVHNGSLILLTQKIMLAGHSIPRRINVLEYAIDIAEKLEALGNNNFRAIRGNNDHKSRTDYSITDSKSGFSHHNSIFKEVLILGQRSCKNIFRTKQLFATRAIQALLAGLVLGTIYLNVGDDMGKVALQTRIGFFAFSLTFLLSSSAEGLPIFLQEKKILMRETSRRAYRVLSYVLADAFIFIPFLLIIGLLFTTPVYWLIGLRRDFDAFLYFSLVIWMVLLMSNSFVACFSALVPDFIMGTSVIAGLMGSFFLFSGYFISKENIPSYWKFMHYLSLFKYPFECLMINEYDGEQGRRRCIELDAGGGCGMYGSGFLKQQGLKENQKWSNLGVIVGFIVGYRVLCFLILWCRCYRRGK